MAKGFAFIGSAVDIDCELPFEISDEITLRRPTTAERKTIKKYLKHVGGPRNNYHPFERTFRAVTKRSKGKLNGPEEWTTIDSTALPRSRWRYLVAAFKDCAFKFGNGCEEINVLRAVSRLGRCPLRLTPLFVKELIWTGGVSDYEYLNGAAVDGEDLPVFTAEHLRDLRHCYLAAAKLIATHPDIVRSMRMFNDVPERLLLSELAVLGLFAVLESLLTHNPRGEYDSIGHQIQKKIALVSKRLPKSLDYTCFGSATSETVWKKLYELRSRIAHGGQIDFEQSLNVLGDAYTVESFLRMALSALIRRAIDEPDLFVDLRAV